MCLFYIYKVSDYENAFFRTENTLIFIFYIFVHKKRGHIIFIMINLYYMHIKNKEHIISGGFYGMAEAAE